MPSGIKAVTDGGTTASLSPAFEALDPHQLGQTSWTAVGWSAAGTSWWIEGADVGSFFYWE